MADILNQFFACELSLQVGEQLFATAARVDVWLLLEYRGAWGSEAFTESDLPQAVKRHLDGQLKAVPKSRLQLIKHDGSSSEKLLFYIAVAREIDPILYRFQLDSYEDLLTFDVPAILSDSTAYQHALSDKQLFLFCTNGRRDKCCTKFGLPVYQAAEKMVGDAAWQTTHLGGHRFAATAVFLPHGIVYGRISPGDIAHLIEAYQQQRLDVGLYRGRSCYAESAQAAEYFLRLETHASDLAQFRLIDSPKTDDSVYTVRFESRSDGTLHIIRLEQNLSRFQVHKNSDSAEHAPVLQFQLGSYEITNQPNL
ncbi:MAG: sucrase ferredoxin [Chloroflexota bacterium]